MLDPAHPEVHLKALDVMVHGRCFATKRAPYSPLRDVEVSKHDGVAWHLGLLHASIAIEGKTDNDEVVITLDEIAASHLDYLALGHWHSTSKGKAGKTVYAYAGAPEPVALDQDRAGKVLLVSLDAGDGKKQVTIEERKVGKTRFERVQLDAATIGSQPNLIAKLLERADPDLVLDAELMGVRPDELDLHVEEVETELADKFLKVRVRDKSVAPLPEGFVASPDTIPGAFARDFRARIAEQEASGDPAADGRRAARSAAPWDAAPRRSAASDPGVNITHPRLNDFRRHAELDIELKPGLNIVRGPNEAGKSTIQRAIELALFRRPTFARAELDDLRPGDTLTSIRRSSWNSTPREDGTALCARSSPAHAARSNSTGTVRR